MTAPEPARQLPTFGEALRFWLKLGFISFGGPTGQIAIMHAELVEKKKWIAEDRFLHALNFCMLIPGPEAQQLAVYCGWLLHRTRGGVVAGTLFVLPAALLLWGLSYVYVAWGNVAAIAAVFDGLKPAVLAIVAAAVLRIGKRALKNEIQWSVAAASFAALFLWGTPFPWIIAGAALIGWLGSRWFPGKFQAGKGKEKTVDPAEDGTSEDRHAEKGKVLAPSFAASLKVAGAVLALWWLPLVAAGLWLGWDHILAQQGLFFSKAAMVTFGGAYAVLPYVSQQAVEHFHWLAPGQMLDGLALAETTPGPLIMVLQFVGFVGAWNAPAPFTPLVAATLGAFLTTWATFLPSFLWIFAGAPHIERLRHKPRVTAALSTITAAVTGVILNLAVWFGVHTLFPRSASVNTFGIALALVAFLGMARWKWNVLTVVAGAGALGLARHLLGL